MPKKPTVLPLLQARIDTELFERFTHQRERWGLSNQELLQRLLKRALPDWEKAKGPPGSDA